MNASETEVERVYNELMERHCVHCGANIVDYTVCRADPYCDLQVDGLLKFMLHRATLGEKDAD